MYSKIKIITSVIVLSFTTIIFSCKKENKVGLEQFELSETQILLGVDEVSTILAITNPENTTEKITWNSSDESIVAIQSNETGKVLGVKGISTGDATITAISTGINQEVEITVIKKIENISLVIEGGTPSENVPSVEYSVVFTPEDATIKDVIWEIENPEIATIDNGIVTAVSEGITYLNVTSIQGGFIASAEIKVIGTDPALIQFDYCSVTGWGSYNAESVVTTGGITNINYSGITPPDNYEYYDTEELTVTSGTTFNLAITNSNGWSRGFVWIDWNGDLDFEDANEIYDPLSDEEFYSGDDPITYNIDIVVPEKVVTGKTRMRILVGDAWIYNNAAIPFIPCSFLHASSTKDFIINIQ